MVGGYFDTPSFRMSRRASVNDLFSGPSRYQSRRLSPLPSPSEEQSLKLSEPQEKNQNAGILKTTNRVKFDTVLDRRPSRSASETGTSLPQRPLPAATTGSTTDKVSAGLQSLPVADVDSVGPAPVNGLTVLTRASSPNAYVADDTDTNVKEREGRAIHSAQERAQRLASLLGRGGKSSPNISPMTSIPTSAASSPGEAAHPLEDGDDIPMISLPEKQFKDYDGYVIPDGDKNSANRRGSSRTAEAHRLVQRIARRDFNFMNRIRREYSPEPITPFEDRDPDGYVERPAHYRGGVLSSLLKLYDQRENGSQYRRGRNPYSRSGSISDLSARGLSPDPAWKLPPRQRKWHEKSPTTSNTSLSGSTIKDSLTSPISMLKRSRSNSTLGSKRMGRPQLEDEIRITVHIAELLSRQRYLLHLCRALMKYGAPTHRLEEYMKMTARVLEIDGQFLYIPGCMIISFDDSSTHTAEVKVVRASQGMELGKLADVHIIYKEVIHDVIGVEEATQRLDEVLNQPDQQHVLLRVLMHGCAAAMVGPFAFNARPIDMPVAFVLGCILGVLQLVLSPRSELYANVFEVSAAIIISFLARAFGSIQYNGQPLFCFSALVQSSIALILPGYVVLCASLELQSRNMVAGSIRMVYAMIYSLFLGFGITIGTAIYGCLDSNASTDYTCAPSPIPNEYLQRFPFVIAFSGCLALVNQAKFRQLPAMLVIAFLGYVVNYFATKRFSTNSQVANALGAFVIGLLANLYSRLRHGLAAAAMLPAIWVLVPSGLSASGSLVSAIVAAEQINTNPSPFSVIHNGTQGFMDATRNMTSSQSHSVTFDVAYGMIQVAIGFTVGLFMAALVIYPFGKKRSALFSF